MAGVKANKLVDMSTRLADLRQAQLAGKLPVADLPASIHDLPANLPASGTPVASKAAIGELPANTGIASKPDLPASKSLPAKRPDYPSLLVPKVTVRIPEDLQEDLRLLMLEKNESFQGIVLLAIRHLLASEQLRQNADCQTVDQMIDDTDKHSTSSVITAQQALDYYAKHTGNEVKERDRQTARLLSGFQGPAIKAGILLSVMRAKARIHSLKYCVGAIQEAAATGVNNSYVTWLEMKKERAGK